MLGTKSTISHKLKMEKLSEFVQNTFQNIAHLFGQKKIGYFRGEAKIDKKKVIINTLLYSPSCSGEYLQKVVIINKISKSITSLFIIFKDREVVDLLFVQFNLVPPVFVQSISSNPYLT